MFMVNVLGVPFYDRDIGSAVEMIARDLWSPTLQNRCISATGAHGLVEAHKDPVFRQVLHSFFINLPDGMPVVWIGRLKGAKSIQRCYGPDFFAALMKATAQMPVAHFLCGGKEGVALQLQQACKDKFDNHHVTGTFCPPFREMTDEEMKDLAGRITESGAQVVWIGLGCPKQEKFAARLSRFTRTGYIVAVGAAFDFHTGNLRQAPKWVQNIGFEWLFRLLMEPKRLYRRYLEVVPMFIWLNLKEFAGYILFPPRRSP
jgi:N-acetylglucosaminyldiphosphoundecaprenol N-acetyl-beta-D-mannosaminyltransferase